MLSVTQRVLLRYAIRHLRKIQDPPEHVLTALMLLTAVARDARHECECLSSSLEDLITDDMEHESRSL